MKENILKLLGELEIAYQLLEHADIFPIVK